MNGEVGRVKQVPRFLFGLRVLFVPWVLSVPSSLFTIHSSPFTLHWVPRSTSKLTAARSTPPMARRWPACWAAPAFASRRALAAAAGSAAPHLARAPGAVGRSRRARPDESHPQARHDAGLWRRLPPGRPRRPVAAGPLDRGALRRPRRLPPDGPALRSAVCLIPELPKETPAPRSVGTWIGNHCRINSAVLVVFSSPCRNM